MECDLHFKVLHFNQGNGKCSSKTDKSIYFLKGIMLYLAKMTFLTKINVQFNTCKFYGLKIERHLKTLL